MSDEANPITRWMRMSRAEQRRSTREYSGIKLAIDPEIEHFRRERDRALAEVAKLRGLLTSKGVLGVVKDYGCPWCTGAIDGKPGGHRSTCAVFGRDGVAR